MYCSVSDIEDVYGSTPVADLTSTTGTANQDLVNKHIQYATAYIDYSLSGTIKLPMKNEHEIIKRLTAQIAFLEMVKTDVSREAIRETVNTMKKDVEDTILAIKSKQLTLNGEKYISSSIIYVRPKSTSIQHGLEHFNFI